jgi:hypothetical protein
LLILPRPKWAFGYIISIDPFACLRSTGFGSELTVVASRLLAVQFSKRPLAHEMLGSAQHLTAGTRRRLPGTDPFITWRHQLMRDPNDEI